MQKGMRNLETKWKKIWKLFAAFFRIGAFTFGGGYAMIPLIQKEAVDKNRWVTEDDILEIIAIAESTPGPIAINSATFVGYRTCGVLGSVAATLGVVLPSFGIIFAISFVLRQFQDLKAVQYALTASGQVFWRCCARLCGVCTRRIRRIGPPISLWQAHSFSQVLWM